MVIEGSHQCKCFSIPKEYLEYFRQRLLQMGFFYPPQEYHGEAFGLAKDLDNTWQFHIRVFSDGRIAAEIEPRWIFDQHLDQSYSFPAHDYLSNLFSILDLPYQVDWCIPDTCLRPRVKVPQSLTSVVLGCFVISSIIIFVAMFSER